MTVELREITSETVGAVIRLTLTPEQRCFVAPNAASLAQAHFSEEAWIRGVWNDGELAGFVMLEDQSLRSVPPPQPAIGLWRLMVDHRHQGRGVGRAIVGQVAAMARARGFDRLHTSYVVAEGGPEGFYRSLGFLPTGEIDGAEVVAALPLGEPE